MQLSDYFQPLNPYTLSFFALLVFSFDIWGTLIKSFLLTDKPDTSRIINWLIGLGFFSFCWFIIRFFLAPTQVGVTISILILDLVALPHYLKTRSFLALIRTLWSLKLPLLIIVPFLPAVFIKASLPPYYSDEMAYHFISPAQLNSLTTWRFDGDFYPNLPQVFDLLFVLTFALTKTYSVVRLIHFSILVTAMLFTFSYLKKTFGRRSAFFFLLAFFSLPQALVLSATIGFVDVAAYSFMLIGMVLLIDFILNRSPSALLISSIFWGLALGTKYTTLTAFAAILPPLSFLIYKLGVKNLFKLVFLLTVFGGYWYLKNLYFYGNPVYPFFSGDTTIHFSGNWTTAVTLSNIRVILDSLFPRNSFLQIMILFSPLLVIVNKNKKTLAVSLFLLAAIGLEFLILRQFSGFYARYHQHLQLWLLLLLSIQLANRYRWVYLVLAVTLLNSFVYTVKLTYDPGFLSSQEINYATGKIDIYDWIKTELPKVYPVIRWCEHPPVGQKVALSPLDPDMIWFEKEGFMRSFLTNCYLAKDIPLEGTPVGDVLKQAVTQKLQFWTVTINSCLPDSQVGPRRAIRDDLDKRTMYLRHLSNLFICNSREVIPYLYYFDYQTLTK